MNFINLTPHEINICDSAGTTIRTVPPSGDVARCAEKRTDAGTLDGVAITRAEFGDVSGLPDAAPDTAYIVSALVLAAVPDRADVFAPGPAVRDDAGRIVGCIGLSCTPAYEVKPRNPFMPPPAAGGTSKPAPPKSEKVAPPKTASVKIPAKANYESQSGKELIYLTGADTPVLVKGEYKVIDGYRASETQKTTGKYLHRIIQLTPDSSSRVLLAIAPQGGRVEFEGVNHYAAIMGKSDPYRLVCSAGLQLNGEFACWNIPADKQSKMIMRGYKARTIYTEATL